MTDPADGDSWFWTDEWQAKEREADDDLEARRGESFDSGEEFLAHLDQLSADRNAHLPDGRRAAQHHQDTRP